MQAKEESTKLQVSNNNENLTGSKNQKDSNGSCDLRVDLLFTRSQILNFPAAEFSINEADKLFSMSNVKFLANGIIFTSRYSLYFAFYCNQASPFLLLEDFVIASTIFDYEKSILLISLLSGELYLLELSIFDSDISVSVEVSNTVNLEYNLLDEGCDWKAQLQAAMDSIELCDNQPTLLLNYSPFDSVLLVISSSLILLLHIKSIPIIDAVANNALKVKCIMHINASSMTIGVLRCNPFTTAAISCCVVAEPDDSVSSYLILSLADSRLCFLEYNPDLDSDKEQSITVDLSCKSFFNSKHKGWITAVSSSTSVCNYVVAGDISGGLSLWCYAVAADDGDGATGEWSDVYFDNSLCKGCKVSVICLDASSLCAWVGDSSGRIIGLQILIQSHSMHLVHELSLFTLPVAPSLICILNTPIIGQKENESKVLFRCYSDQCGEGVECLLSRGIVSVLRVWPDPVSSSSTCRNLVEVCVVLTELNLIVVADFQRTLYLWDIASGRLLSSIMTLSHSCSALAGFDSHSSNSEPNGRKKATLFSGHRDGKVHMYEIDLEQNIAEVVGGADEGARSDEVGSVNDDKDALFDLLDSTEPEEGTGASTNSSSISHNSSTLPENSTVSYRTDSTAKLLQETLAISQFSSVRHKRALTLQPSLVTVSDIFTSSTGENVLTVHLRQFLYLYNIQGAKRKSKSAKPIMSYKLDEAAKHISILYPSMLQETHGINSFDRLLLVIQTSGPVKVFDAITMSYLVSIPLTSPENLPIKSAVMWDQTEGVDHYLMGLCASGLSQWFAFNNSDGLKKVMTSVAGNSSADSISQLEDIVIGIKSFNADHSPIIAAWALKSCLLLRLQPEGNHGLTPMKSRLYKVMSISKGSVIKVVTATALKVESLIRSHRAAVVLSNGFAAIINL